MAQPSWAAPAAAATTVGSSGATTVVGPLAGSASAAASAALRLDEPGAVGELRGEGAEPLARLGRPAPVVELDRHLRPLRFGDHDPLRDGRLEYGRPELAAVLLDPGSVLAGGWPYAVDDQAVDHEVGIHLVLDRLHGAHQVAHPVGRVLVGLHDEQHAVRGRDRDLQPEPERGRRVDQDDVDALGCALAQDAASLAHQRIPLILRELLLPVGELG
jgi:hypothetical protein